MPLPLGQHTPREVLRQYFGEDLQFRDIQEEVIETVLAGSNSLCLMATGSGKSLIYQVAGLVSGMTTLVLSPLIALMGQQVQILQDHGIPAVSLSDFTTAQAYEALRQFPFGTDPSFLFLSPERAAFDGFLEYVLKRQRQHVGLIVLDEAHCVSQWGYTFRPAYAAIPRFLDRVFGRESWPRVLCLTATLNPNDQREIQSAFCVEVVHKSPALLRQNLHLHTEILPHEEAKIRRLHMLLAQHHNDKVIVYVHRKKSLKYGTRAMAEQFASAGLRCQPFDGDMDTGERMAVLDAFIRGDTQVVFATSAFGMGIDIPDIRVVIHYLVPESVEQYYQEVGRAGRDGSPAYGYLLYTDKNAAIREELIQGSMPTREEVQHIFHRRFCSQGRPYRSMEPWLDFSEENAERILWYYLEEKEVVSVVGKGPGQLDCFQPYASQPCPEYERYRKASHVGLVLGIARKLNLPVEQVISEMYAAYYEKHLRAVRVPEKRIFFTSPAEFPPDILDEIMVEIHERIAARLQGFRTLRNFIETHRDPEEVIRETLGVVRGVDA